MDIVEKITESIKDLPTLPTIFYAISEAMNNPRSTTDDIAKIVSTDQASAFKVLKVANSPFFGFRGRIDTIPQAILHLGFNELKNIILALSVIKFFSKSKYSEYLKPRDFWAHSIAAGICTRMLGASVKAPNLEQYFLAGILHDIGKLLLLDLLGEQYLEVFRIIEKKNCLIKEAERASIGIDHAEAGRLLAERWKLPPVIKNTIYYHHFGLNDGKADTLTACVHMADIAVRMFDLGNPGDHLVPQPNLKALNTLALPADVFTDIAPALMIDFSQTISHILD
ncbi:MAG TPA: HDOD domain-containing protein [Ignavibacteriales bacterium]|nr:HDOD domain-containing protein [Ignavibacteriales bacterium]